MADCVERWQVLPIRSLPPHPDVGPAIKRLRERGYRLGTLTNSSNAVVADQLKNAGLDTMFDDAFSIESVGLYKPHSHVYRWAAHRAKVDVSECLLVAAHGWDVAGAEWAGMETAFVARPQQQPFLLGQTQSLTVSTLEELAGRLMVSE